MTNAHDENVKRVDRETRKARFWFRFFVFVTIISVALLLGVSIIKHYNNVKQRQALSAETKNSVQIQPELKSADQRELSVMEYDKTQHEPIKFVDGIARRTINVSSIITEDCGANMHCVSYLKEHDGPHFMIGSLFSPANFGISTVYHCTLSPDETGLTAAVIDSCDEIQ